MRASDGASASAGCGGSSYGIPPFRLEPPKQHENDNDDEDEADDADATMPESVAVAAKTATEKDAV
jgi:hypothetical protein